MNRVTRLLHKTRFLSRQSRAIAFGHKYVITAEDLDLPMPQEPTSKVRMTETEAVYLIDSLLDGFDPEKNEMDRRIYYEITGMKLAEGEFRDFETSDEEWRLRNIPDPQLQLFSYNQFLSDD